MKTRGIQIFKYRLPFVKPLRIFTKILAERVGYILKITDENNHNYFGEIAPLPLDGAESLDDAYKQLVNTCLKIKKREELDYESMYPSVLFGILSATNFNKPQTYSSSYSGLIYEDFNLKYFNPILDTYKLKLSSLSFENAAEFIKNIKQKFPKLNLRLDINQAWSYSDTSYFLEKFKPDDFEYIEEPCKSISETKKILKNTPHKIALDESLKNWSYEELACYKNIKALIIKPSIINFTNYTNCKIPLVFSSAFETGVGLLNILRLSKLYSSKKPGLDTYKFFKNFILKKPISFESTVIVDSPISLNKKFLKLCLCV